MTHAAADGREPTRGQQRILQLLCRVSYALEGERVSGVPQYRILERGTGRVVMASVSVAMVTQLTQAGWIEPEARRMPPRRERETQTWVYSVTQAGIAAANGPSRHQE